VQDEAAVDDGRDSERATIEARDGERYYNLVLSPLYNFVLLIRSQSPIRFHVVLFAQRFRSTDRSESRADGGIYIRLRGGCGHELTMNVLSGFWLYVLID
jgi:hypothetical protein